MKELAGAIKNEIIKIIDSKENSEEVAWQFILEELDAANNSSDLAIRDKILTFYINENDYIGAIKNSWEDVSGENGPKLFLRKCMIAMLNKYALEKLSHYRLYIVESLIKHYNFGRYHINTKIQNAKKPLNLFTPTTSKDKFNPNFEHLLIDENSAVRDVLNRWAAGFEDRDNKFNHEFQTTFNSSFWELYLFQCFKDLNMSVDFSKSSPDFTVTTKNQNIINIEAVTANHAVDSDPEWESDSNNKNIKDEDSFLNFSSIRILNSITEKHKKYVKSYSKLPHSNGNPFIIAVAPFEQRMFFKQNNEAINRVLYAQGLDKKNGFKVIPIPYATKNSEAKLDLGIFTNDKYKEISAVIFSTIATFSKAATQSDLKRTIRTSRYHKTKGLIVEFKDNADNFETHLDGLQIHHNPYAEKKLDINDFPNYEITHYFYDPVTKEIDNQQRSYTIISRQMFSTQ